MGQFKYEQLMNRDAELSREYLQVFKRRSIDSAFDQAKKVHGDSEEFGEFFLAHLSRRTDRPETITEFFAETRQIKFHLSADSRLRLFHLPPNKITGAFKDRIGEWVKDIGG